MRTYKRSKQADMVTIDGEKLREVFANDNKQRISLALGMSKNWLSNTMTFGRANKGVLERACMLKAVDVNELIMPDAPKPVKVEPVKAEVLAPTDTATLLELIGELERRVNELEAWKRRVTG